MSDSPWIKFYPSDWLAGTRGMSATEAGVYINLIAMMYESGGYLALDATRLARLCGATGPVFKRAFDALVEAGKIVIDGDHITNNRVLETLLIRTEKSALAKQSANSRWAKKPNKNKATNDADASKTQCEPDAYQKPDTRVIPRSPNGDPPPQKPPKGSRLPHDWQPTPDERAFACNEGLTDGECDREADKFRDYWTAQPGQRGVKRDWGATWRNWVRRRAEDQQRNRGGGNSGGGGKEPRSRLADYAEVAAEMDLQQRSSAGGGHGPWH